MVRRRSRARTAERFMGLPGHFVLFLTLHVKGKSRSPSGMATKEAMLVRGR
jgi:hypothetical protein